MVEVGKYPVELVKFQCHDKSCKKEVVATYTQAVSLGAPLHHGQYMNHVPFN